MSWTLLAPAGLFALLALALPLLIHLSRRQPLRIIEFAALRWLGRQQRPQARLRLQQWLLLVLRMVLISLLALWLAEPAFAPAHAGKRVIAIWPGASAPEPDDAEVDIVWLRPGLPTEIADSSHGAQLCGPTCSPASLLRELDGRLPAAKTLTVRVPEQMRGLDARRIVLTRPVEWEIVPGLQDSDPASSPLNVSLRTDVAADSRWYWLRTALQVLSEPIGDAFPSSITLDVSDSTAAPPAGISVLVWAREGALSPEIVDWLKSGGRVLALRGSAQAVLDEVNVRPPAEPEPGAPASIRFGSGELRLLDAIPDPQSMSGVLDPEFPRHVLAWVQRSREPSDRAHASMVRPLLGSQASAAGFMPVQDWLVPLILLLLALERGVALRARGRVGK